MSTELHSQLATLDLHTPEFVRGWVGGMPDDRRLELYAHVAASAAEVDRGDDCLAALDELGDEEFTEALGFVVRVVGGVMTVAHAAKPEMADLLGRALVMSCQGMASIVGGLDDEEYDDAE